MTKRELEEQNSRLLDLVEETQSQCDRLVELYEENLSIHKKTCRTLKEILVELCENEDSRDCLLDNPEFYADVKTDVLLGLPR